MKNRALKKILMALSIFTVCVMMLAGTSCSYLIYSIYMSNYEKQLIEEELKRREEQNNQNGGEAISREVYYNSVSSGEKTGYQMFTIVDSKSYTLDAYEYISPAGGSAYSSKIFRMQGNYTREGNVVTVEPGISMYAYTTGASSSQEFYPGESEAERKAIYESFVGGEKYGIALNSDGSFEPGGTSDSTETVTGVSGAKVYRWYDDSSRITIKTLTIFEDDKYIITAFSTHSTNHEQPVSSFIANGTLAYDESKATDEYKIVSIQDRTGMCYVSNNGSPMWNDCISDALHANWWDLSISSRAFYITDEGFTYKNGLLSEEIPAGGLYGYEEKGEDKPEEPDKPEIVKTLKGDKNEAIQLILYSDGTADFTFTTYNATTSGKWSYKDGVFTFEGTSKKQDGTDVEFKNESEINADGSIVIAIDVKNGLTQDFTLTAEEFAEIKNAARQEIATLKGDKNEAIQLILYIDGTADFTFTTYNATTSGKWSYKDGVFTFEGTSKKQDGTDVEFKNESEINADGSIVIAIDVKNGLTQDFTLTAEEFAEIIA